MLFLSAAWMEWVVDRCRYFLLVLERVALCWHRIKEIVFLLKLGHQHRRWSFSTLQYGSFLGDLNFTFKHLRRLDFSDEWIVCRYTFQSRLNHCPGGGFVKILSGASLATNQSHDLARPVLQHWVGRGIGPDRVTARKLQDLLFYYLYLGYWRLFLIVLLFLRLHKYISQAFDRPNNAALFVHHQLYWHISCMLKLIPWLHGRSEFPAHLTLPIVNCCIDLPVQDLGVKTGCGEESWHFHLLLLTLLFIKMHHYFLEI